MIHPFLSAFEFAMAPYNLEPLWQHLTCILTETKDDAMLNEVLQIFRDLFRQKEIPPLSVQPDLYRKFKDLSTAPLEGETKLTALGFQAALIRLLGLEFIVNPPIHDPGAKEFAWSLIFSPSHYKYLDEGAAGELLRNPPPQNEALLVRRT